MAGDDARMLILRWETMKGRRRTPSSFNWSSECTAQCDTMRNNAKQRAIPFLWSGSYSPPRHSPQKQSPAVFCWRRLPFCARREAVVQPEGLDVGDLANETTCTTCISWKTRREVQIFPQRRTSSLSRTNRRNHCRASGSVASGGKILATTTTSGRCCGT